MIAVEFVAAVAVVRFRSRLALSPCLFSPHQTQANGGCGQTMPASMWLTVCVLARIKGECVAPWDRQHTPGNIGRLLMSTAQKITPSPLAQSPARQTPLKFFLEPLFHQFLPFRVVACRHLTCLSPLRHHNSAAASIELTFGIRLNYLVVLPNGSTVMSRGDRARCLRAKLFTRKNP